MEEVVIPARQKVGQEQIHSLLFSEQLSWQAIIYDLINTEQLDPWDIDISLLAGRFLEKVRELEEANFFISSKVLLAAALLLRMKSEILLERDIPELDRVLYGIKEAPKAQKQERLELDEEIPELILRTPLPRYKKVTLENLLRALAVAMKTENRRIQRIALTKQQEFETAASLPKKRINLHDSLKQTYERLEDIFGTRKEKLAFSDFSGSKRDDKLFNFISLLHLDTQHKVWLEQEEHCREIWIWLKEHYERENAGELARLRKEAEEALQEFRNELDSIADEKAEENEEVEDNEDSIDGKDKFVSISEQKDEDE